jgi:fatty-acyl-CoA synthase
MAAIMADGEPDFEELREHLARLLPPYARPKFIRITHRIAATATFKHAKAELVREGFDPAATNDPVYFDDAASKTFVRLDAALYARIQAGKVRL